MPVAALLPAIIGAGTAITGLLSNRGSSGGSSNSSVLPSSLDQTALSSMIGKQTGLADFFTDTGKSTLNKGGSTLQGPLDFYQSILGGDRTAMSEALAPEVAAINAQFRQPLKEAQITGRGGALAPDLEASKQSAISNLLFQERPAAADKLASIAQGLMGLGTQQMGLGANTLGQAGGELLDYNSIIRGIQAQTRGDSANMWGQLGMSLGPILQAILGGSKSSGGGWGDFKLPPIGM